MNFVEDASIEAFWWAYRFGETHIRKRSGGVIAISKLSDMDGKLKSRRFGKK
jgi:hypothetical protein